MIRRLRSNAQGLRRLAGCLSRLLRESAAFVSSLGRERDVLQSFVRILAMASSDPPSAGDRDVFSGLPNARPQRRSAKRDAGKRAAPKKAPPRGRAAASTKPAPAASGKAPPKAAAKPKASPVPPAGYATPTDH